MASESFETFKPSAYNLIKEDHGDCNGDFNDDFLLSSNWCPSDFAKIDKAKTEVEDGKKHYTESRFAGFELHIVNSARRV